MMTTMERSTSSITTNNSSSVIMAMDDPTEISIFDAQKYFNDLNLLQPHKSTSVVNGGGGGVGGGGGNRVSPLDNVLLVEASRFSSASSSIDSYSSSNNNTNNTNRNSYMKNRSFRSAATPTASSEASWNSQTGLLSAPPGSVAVSLRNPTLSSSADKRATATAAAAATTPFSGVRWLNLRRKCPCLCKKSVQVKEKSVRTISESHVPIPQIVLPPSSSSSSVDRSVHGHVLRGGSGSGSSTTNGSIKSTMAEIRSGTIGNNSSFEETWGNAHHQSRRNSRNSRGSDTITRSLSSSSAMEMTRTSTNDHVKNGDDDDDDPLKLKVLHGRSSTGGFTFPILNSSSSSSPIIKMTLLKDPVSMASSGINPIPEDPARDSLEIFSPPSHSNRKTHRSHHHHHQLQLQIQPTNNFTFLTTSPTSRARTNNTAIINNTTDVDDGASDASSDLFEIESFSTQTTATTTTTTSTATTAAHPSIFVYHRQRRDSHEEAAAGVLRFAPNSTVMAGLYHRRTSLEDTTDYAYEPSEASIDWSVTTAEGFDRASVANASEADYGEYLVAPPHAAEVEKNRRRSSGNGLLMSCRCEKAVSVGPGPRPMSRPAAAGMGPMSGGGGGGEHGRAMWAVGHKG